MVVGNSYGHVYLRFFDIPIIKKPTPKNRLTSRPSQAKINFNTNIDIIFKMRKG